VDRLEDAVREGERVADLVLLLRGGEDTEAKLLRQAALLERRFNYAGRPVRGISLFAARGDLDARVVLGTKLRTYPKYRRVRGAALAELVVLLPTFRAPHWTALFHASGGPDRPEEALVADLLDILGPVLDNPKYVPDRSRRR
jgi:hypothetical protein